MKFEQRKSAAQTAVVAFLSGFAPPRGLSEDAMKSHITNIAGAFARRLPVTDAAQFSENLEKTFTTIRDHHKGYAWPVQSEFVDAMPKGVSATGPKLEPYKPAADRGMANRMAAGEGVPEEWVWGPSSWSLVSSGQVSREVMDRYRTGSVNHFKQIYRHDAYGMLQSKYGDVVGPYFEQKHAAE